MKKLFCITILLATLTISCKKETPTQPSTPMSTSTPPTEFYLSVIELSDISPTFVSPKAKVINESGNVDSVITLTIDTTVAYSNFPTGNLCAMNTINSVKVSRPLASASSFYRVEVYSGTTLVRKWKITKTNVVDEGAIGVGKICSYSPHKVMVGY
ncbi:MAG: hypothetical protein WAQ28_12955 [Bacteroidia bacterium]